MHLRGLFVLAFILLGQTVPSYAQTFPVFQEPRVAFLDRDALFTQSDIGEALQEQNLLITQELSAELRKLEAELSQEETSLVEQRKTDDPDIFKEKARIFDEKVKKIRAEQDQRVRDLKTASDRARFEFYRKADPILRELMRERGISLLLNQNTVLIAMEDADITQEAIERINAQMMP